MPDLAPKPELPGFGKPLKAREEMSGHQTFPLALFHEGQYVPLLNVVGHC